MPSGAGARRSRPGSSGCAAGGCSRATRACAAPARSTSSRATGARWPLIEVKARRAGGAAEAVGPERVAGLSRAAQWLADSRGYEWVRLIRLDLVTIDGHRVRYLADAFRL